MKEGVSWSLNKHFCSYVPFFLSRQTSQICFAAEFLTQMEAPYPLFGCAPDMGSVWSVGQMNSSTSVTGSVLGPNQKEVRWLNFCNYT